MKNKIIGKIAPVFVGDFDIEQEYSRLDITFYKGESWVCLYDHTIGIEPGMGETWRLVSERGYQGVQGTQGSQGSIGHQGYQGDKPVVTAKSGDYANNVGIPSVTVEHGSENQTILVFNHLKGTQGHIGNQGTQGQKGNQGDIGYQGNQGNQGYQGNQGNQGSRGYQGYKGYQGLQGSVGQQGNQGNQGEPGLQGNQGNQGNQGSRGYQGIQGVQGSQGTIGVRGFQGEQGMLGNQGHRGFQGEKGDQGIMGTGLNIKQYKNQCILPGDLYLDDSNGHMYVFDGVEFRDLGSIRGLQGFQGNQGNQGVIGKQGQQGEEGSQGEVGSQGDSGIQGEVGEVYVPVINDEYVLKYVRTKVDGTQSTIGDYDLIPEIVTYGYSKLANPEITKNDTFATYKAKNPKPIGTPFSLGEIAQASVDMPYIWKSSNKINGWEIIDAYYIPPEEMTEVVGKGIAEPIINVTSSYGAVVVETDLTWAIFQTSLAGTDWTSIGAITFYPTIVLNPYEIAKLIPNSYDNSASYSDRLSTGSTSTEFALTLERWDRNKKSDGPIMTTKDAVKKIFDVIKESNPETGFKWSKFQTYYTGDFPFSPIVIKFTNGIFTIQDIHNLKVVDDELTRITLFGSLSVFNSMNSFIQGSHAQMHKYALDTGMKIDMGISSDVNDIQIGSSKKGFEDPQQMSILKLLPCAY